MDWHLQQVFTFYYLCQGYVTVEVYSICVSESTITRLFEKILMKFLGNVMGQETDNSILVMQQNPKGLWSLIFQSL